VVLAILLGFFIYTIFTRPILETSILRIPGTLYQTTEQGYINNIYNMKIVNKTHENIPVEVKLLSHKGHLKMTNDKAIVVTNHEMFESVLIIEILPSELKSGENEIEFGVYRGDELIETYEAGFLAP
jgi:hypothetical protein